MQMETLRYFIELAQAGSFYGAARNAFISQQGLNKAVTALEDELGVKLVERGSRGVRLTTGGDIFLDYARRALADYASMLDELYAENRYVAPDAPPLVFHVTYYPAQISRPFIDGMGVIESVRVSEEGFRRIVESVASSDGSELYLVDVYAETADELERRTDLLFEPMLVSQFGVVCQDGSPLSGHRVVHREQLADVPLAVDSHRNTMRLVEDIMQDYPLNNIRIGVSEPRMTLEYAAKSKQVASMFDSFGFELAQRSPSIMTDGLNFTPLSTPRSLRRVGFLYARNARPNVRARHAIERLRRHLAEHYADYFARYPLR